MESFIVRVWRPEEGDGPTDGRLRGQLIRLSTGTTSAFRDSYELMALIHGDLEEGSPPPGADAAPAERT